MATHSSILDWKIPGMEEPGRLQSMGSQKVGHECATSLLQTLKWLEEKPVGSWDDQMAEGRLQSQREANVAGH